MSEIAIVIGNKNYSSWSIRGWLPIKLCGIEFDEIILLLDMPDTKEKLIQNSKAGLVPVLKCADITIWETMAICEYLAETYPAARLWPDDAKTHAYCRSVSNKIHAGFVPLRCHMPMDIKITYPGEGRGPRVKDIIARIVDIWADFRKYFGQNGPFLFGEFTIADAMFAPVVACFKTFAVDVPEVTMAYIGAVCECPEMQEWRAAAEAETQIIKYV